MINSPSAEERLAVLENEVKSIHGEIEKMRAEVSALVDAWNAATGLVKFVKLLSTLVAAIGAIYVFFTHGVPAKGG